MSHLGDCECGASLRGDPAVHDRTCPYVRGAIECVRCPAGRRPRLTFRFINGEPVCSRCEDSVAKAVGEYAKWNDNCSNASREGYLTDDDMRQLHEAREEMFSALAALEVAAQEDA